MFYEDCYRNNAAMIYLYDYRTEDVILKTLHVNNIIRPAGQMTQTSKEIDDLILASYIGLCDAVLKVVKGQEIIVMEVNMDVFRKVTTREGEHKNRQFYYQSAKMYFNDDYALEHCFDWLFNNVYCQIYPYNEIDFDYEREHNVAIRNLLKGN